MRYAAIRADPRRERSANLTTDTTARLEAGENQYHLRQGLQDRADCMKTIYRAGSEARMLECRDGF